MIINDHLVRGPLGILFKTSTDRLANPVLEKVTTSVVDTLLKTLRGQVLLTIGLKGPFEYQKQ